MTEEAKKESGTPPTTKAAVTPAPAAQKKDDVAPKTAPVKKEKPEKCEQCAKALSRVKWYYRNGGYYCTKRCWKEFKAKREEEKKKAESGAPAKA